MSKGKWLACIILQAIMVLKICVGNVKYSDIMLGIMLFIFALDAITYLRQNSKSYPKEVGEYDYEYSSFPIHIFLFMGFVCCFQNGSNSFVTGSYIVAMGYSILFWFYIFGTLLFPILGIYDSIRILSNSKRNSFWMMPAKYEWYRITVCCIFVITLCQFMTL